MKQAFSHVFPKTMAVQSYCQSNNMKFPFFSIQHALISITRSLHVSQFLSPSHSDLFDSIFSVPILFFSEEEKEIVSFFFLLFFFFHYLMTQQDFSFSFPFLLHNNKIHNSSDIYILGKHIHIHTVPSITYRWRYHKNDNNNNNMMST